MKTLSGDGQITLINEMQMYYEVRGQGEPLILLHGFTGSGANWELIFKEPPDGYRMIIPDLRGHGRSTNPSMAFTHRQSALDVFALPDRLNIERFQAIGVSCGAKTLLHMATQQPNRVEAMVLVSAAHYFPEQARAIMGRMTADNRAEEEWRLRWPRAYFWRDGRTFCRDLVGVPAGRMAAGGMGRSTVRSPAPKASRPLSNIPQRLGNQTLPLIFTRPKSGVWRGHVYCVLMTLKGRTPDDRVSGQAARKLCMSYLDIAL